LLADAGAESMLASNSLERGQCAVAPEMTEQPEVAGHRCTRYRVPIGKGLPLDHYGYLATPDDPRTAPFGLRDRTRQASHQRSDGCV
jgi:hypothetical protein